MDVHTIQAQLAAQQQYMAQSQAYSGMVGQAARGQPMSPALAVGALGGPAPIGGTGAGLSPAMAPEAHRFAGMGMAAAGGVGMAAFAGLGWASMTHGFQNMGSRGRYLAGALDPFSSAVHGFTGNFRASAVRAGMSSDVRGFGNIMRGGYGTIMAKGGLRGLAGAGARAVGTAGLAMLPALAIGGGVAYGLRQMGAGAGEFLSTSGTMHEIAEYTGMRGGFSASDVGTVENTIQGMMRQDMDLGQQRSDMMGLMRTAGAAGEFSRAGDAKQFSQKFKKLVSETKAVAKLLDSNLSEAYGMMKSFKGLGYFDSGGQMNALAGVTFGARGTGLSADTILTGMATGVQAAPGMGISRRAGADLGRMMTTGIGQMLKTDTKFAQQVFEATGLQGDQAAYQMTSQWMGHRAQMRQNPMTQAIIAASMNESGQVDEWKLNNLLSGGMSGEALMKAGAKAMENKRIASMVATRGGAAWKRINQIAGPENLATSLSRLTSEATGMTIDASMMSTTGMDTATYGLMRQANRSMAGAAVEGQMRGLEGRLNEMQAQKIRDMIDPRKIVERQWTTLKNELSRPIRDAGRRLMQRAVKFVEGQTAQLQSDLMSYTSPELNASFRQAFAGGGVSDYMRGLDTLSTLVPGGFAGAGVSSLPLSYASGLGGVGGAAALDVSARRHGTVSFGPDGFFGGLRYNDNLNYETSIGVTGGAASGVQLTPFRRSAGAWNVNAGQRDITRSLAGGQSAGIYRSIGSSRLGLTAGIMGSPLARMSRVGHVGRWAAGMRGIDTGSLVGGSKSIYALKGGGAIGRAGRAARLGVRGVGGALGGASKMLGVAGWGLSLGLAGFDAVQYGQDIAAKNAAIDREGWYGYAAGAFDERSMRNLAAPTPELASLVAGDIAKLDAGFGDYAGVFGASFIGGFGEMFSPGAINWMEEKFGVDRGRDAVSEIALGGGTSMYAYGTKSAVGEFEQYLSGRDDAVTWRRAGAQSDYELMGTLGKGLMAIPAAAASAVTNAIFPGSMDIVDRARSGGRGSVDMTWAQNAATRLRRLHTEAFTADMRARAQYLGVTLAEGESGQRSFAYRSKKYNERVLITEAGLNNIAGAARTAASSYFGNETTISFRGQPVLSYGISDERMKRFSRDLSRRSKAWDPTVVRKMQRGEWDAQVRAHVNRVEEGGSVIAGIDIAAGAGSSVDLAGHTGASVAAGRDIAAGLGSSAVAAMIGASGSADVAGLMREGRFGEVRNVIANKLAPGGSTSSLLQAKRLMREFNQNLALGLGAGTIKDTDLTKAMEIQKYNEKGELVSGISDFQAKGVIAKLGMTESGVLGLGGEMSDAERLRTLLSGTSVAARETKLKAGEAWKGFALDTAKSLRESQAVRRMQGMGFAGASESISAFMKFNQGVAGMDAQNIGMESSRLMTAQSAIMNQFYSQFGEMTAGERNLMMKQLASSDALQGIFGHGARNINAAIGMGVRSLEYTKKKGQKKGARARFEGLEAFMGTTFDASGLDLWGLGSMDDPRVTLNLQEKMRATFQAQFGDKADVGNLTKMATDYLRDGGGWTEKKMQRFMSEFGAEKTRLSEQSAAPQSAEVTANKDVLKKLTELLEPGGKNLFAEMADSLSMIQKSGFKMNITLDPFGGGSQQTRAVPTEVGVDGGS